MYFMLSRGLSHAGKTIAGWSFLISSAVSLPFVLDIFHDRNWLEWPVIFAALCSFYYLAGKYFFREEPHFWLRPFQTSAIIGTFILSLIYTYNIYDHYDTLHFSHNMRLVLAVSLISIAALVFLILLISRKSYVNVFPASTVVMIFLLQFLNELNHHTLTQILANAFLLAFGIHYIWNGISSRKIYLVNLGMLFIAALAIARFFESDLNFMIKGFGFILVGLGFLSANLFINRRLKKQDA